MQAFHSARPFEPIEPSQFQTSPESLFTQKGWYLLPDVFRVLAPGDHTRYKLVFKQATRIAERGEDPFEVMGYKKIDGRVCVLMERFAPWYQNNPLFQLERLDHSSLEDFLAQKFGYFRLSEVCKHFQLPYTYNIIKRMVDRSADGLEEFGVQKFNKNYIVKLPEFAVWLEKQLSSDAL